MRKRSNISIIIMTSLVFLMISAPVLKAHEESVTTAAAETTEAKHEEPARKSTPYDDITWNDVYAKRGTNRGSDPYMNLFSFMYRERRIESVTGEDVTVVETATYSDDDTVVAPVVVVNPD